MRDENGNFKYRIKGKALTPARRFSVWNAENEEIAVVKQKMWCVFPQYRVCLNGRVVAEIKKERSYFKPRYIVDELNWIVEGDFFGHRYAISCGDRIVAEIRKAWMSWGDNYEIDIANPKDEIVSLITVIVIDCMMESNAN